MAQAYSYSRWTTCYNKSNASGYISENAKKQLLQFKFNTIYYQTFGGGPEGGFFVKYTDDTFEEIVGIWSVSRSWGEPFTAKKLVYALNIQEQGGEIRLVKQRVNNLRQQWNLAA
jgi:hypothetical protein